MMTKVMNDRELRNVRGIELRTEADGTVPRKVCGYAIRFNEQSEDLGFIETISPNAITQEQIDSSDIFAFYDHDSSKVLARSNNGEGTLKLEVREDGVYYEFDAPHTEVGNELLEHIRRNELFGTSFGFALVPDSDSDTWEKRGEVWYRTINKIDYLFEISPCFSPAYPTTSCLKRNNEKMEKMDNVLNNLQSQLDEIINGVKAYNVTLED